MDRRPADLICRAAESPATFAGVLSDRAAAAGGKRVFTFLDDGECESARLSYADLDRRARAIAALLQHHRLPGERVVLVYEPGLEYVCALCACLYSGVVAVPAPPPPGARRRHAHRLE
ncbi:MAG: AMP-binding protein, partial [Vicinamibacterales bacterium]